jgi:hypothetical protein
VELISLMLLPLGIFMCCYALYVFTWRAENIAKKRAHNFDDRVGPLWLCGLVSTSLSAIFIICAVDFYEVMHETQNTPSPPLPPLPGFPPPYPPL